MDKGTEYHKIYQIAKGKIEWFAEAVGKTIPGQSKKALRFTTELKALRA